MDKARKETDKRLAKMEAELTKIYQKSAKGIYANWNKYMDEADKKLKPLQNAYDKAKQGGDADETKSAGIALSKAKREITLQSNQYRDMLSETTKRLAEVNQTAVAYLNESIPDIYALNYNAISGDAAKVGVKFGLVDAHTIEKLVIDGDIKLPYKKLNVPKDMRWNTKQLNSAVLQGILQGDSMRKIAKRITPIVDNNAKAAIRNARTMVTGAECAGRNDSYKDLESQGVVLKKVWIATPDDRTRESHFELDGEEVGVNEEFSNGLMFPGDESGDPSEVYNCRCSIRTHIIGVRNDDGSISEIDFEREETLHDRQMEEEKERRISQEAQKYTGGYTEEEKIALKEYTLSYYSGINSYLRGEEGFENEEVKEIIKHIDNAMKKSITEDNIEVYRGSSVRDIIDMFGEGKRRKWFEKIDNLKSLEGEIGNFSSYLSTSVGSLQSQYNAGVIWDFVAEKGTKSIDMREISAQTSENERLFDRNSKIKIIKIDAPYDEDGDVIGVIKISAIILRG